MGAGLGGFVVFQDQRENDRIEAADDVGAQYLTEVSTFRLRVAKALKGADADDPAALRKALDTAIADPPSLPVIDGSAARKSSTYAEAQRVADDLLTPYETFGEALTKAERDRRFVDAAQKVLKLRATDYVDSVLLDSSSQVRGSLIPAFVSARDEFAQVDVPEGAEKAAELTRAALQEVIDKATVLADSIDANRSYTFTYGQSFQTAIQAVDDYAAQANGDFSEAVIAIGELR